MRRIELRSKTITNDHSPIRIFRDNWDRAKSLGDANAAYCTLATVAEDGQVSMRTLVLRDIDDQQFVVFVNSTSEKWRQLKNSERCEMLVFWPTLMQQYRIRGTLQEIPLASMAHHWAKKPYDSKLLDHFYRENHSQTSAIQSRSVLVNGIEQLKQRYPIAGDVPFPGNAQGLAIDATYMEIWHGSEADRLHNRNRYTLSDNGWNKETLVP